MNKAEESAILSEGKMNIKYTKAFFKMSWEYLRPDFDSSIERNKEIDPEEPLPNDNYYHALAYTDYMFRKTMNELRMLSGSDGDGFLETLIESFEGALGRIQKSEGFAHIILVNEKAPEFLRAMGKRYDRLAITQAELNEGQEIEHTIICDKHMFRAEKVHGPLNDDTLINEIKADVYFNSKRKAGLAIKSFDDTWSYLNG